MKRRQCEDAIEKLYGSYYNEKDIYRIADDPRVRPYLRGKHCWYERQMNYKGHLYAQVLLILGGGEQVRWLIKHQHLTNTHREQMYKE